MVKQYSFNQIHLIPFDLGCIFDDILAFDNKKNVKFVNKFIESLKEKYKDKKEVIVTNYIKEIKNDKLVFLKNKIVDNAICGVKLQENLICYILTNGIGVFVLADLDNSAIKSNLYNGLMNQKISIVASYQKKTSQSLILSNIYKDDFSEINNTMLEFRNYCWNIVDEASKKNTIVKVRKTSSTKSYKSNGLSYVLTIYLFDNSSIDDNEIKYLMYSNIFGHVTKNANWKQITKEINKKNFQCDECVVNLSDCKIHFAWSGVGVVNNQLFNSFDEILKNDNLSSLIKVEIYVQSRWFIADNCIDNVNKNRNCTLENLQRIESMIEFQQAELENEISANMNTMQKQMLNKIIDSSAVKKLYKSVLSQIQIQKKIKEAHYEDKKSKNRFIANCLIAIFTACSLYKTVNELINKSFDWKNIVLLLVLIIMTIGTVAWNYRNS